MPVDRLTPADAPAAIASLAAAFADYPLVRAIAPANARRASAAFCGMLVRYTVASGAAYTTSDRQAVACWLPPDRGTVSPLGLVRSGVLPLAWELGLRGALLLERLGRDFERQRRRHVPGPHWYLILLGVAPIARGRGLARAVLQPVFATADAAGLSCYLETEDAANVAVYTRLGFAVVGSRRVAGGLWNWEMTRAPVTPAAATGSSPESPAAGVPPVRA
jgi:ribosomal protein S18 acetylase RimI-like enzyme